MPDQEILSELWCQDRIHTDAWCICCCQGCKRSSSPGLCMSSPIPLHRVATQQFDERYKRKQSESLLSQPELIIWVSRHRTLRTQYSHLGVFHWKQCIIIASYKDFFKLQSFFMYSFTHTNIVFLFRHLPTEIVIFINVCYQIKCFSGDSFSFFRSRFS